MKRKTKEEKVEEMALKLGVPGKEDIIKNMMELSNEVSNNLTTAATTVFGLAVKQAIKKGRSIDVTINTRKKWFGKGAQLLMDCKVV